MSRRYRTTRDRLDTDTLTHRERADRRAAFQGAYGRRWERIIEQADKGAQ